MVYIISQLLGGIGLFLLGMALMTDSLKALAGETLRQWLLQFTGSPLKALFSGIGLTVLVQSSTATTLATIGFVSAGALTFSNAIGVIIGANIGTTSTGWLVALLGLKISIASFALPFIGIGAMLKFLGKDSLALLGLAIAGFGLIFLGIDILQIAMSGFASQVNLSFWSDDTLLTRFFLIIVGIVMTVLLQSSSAAVATTLAALSTQTIDLSQALSLVIGQNVGTVATAILASLGATASAKRTAAVHMIFNIVTAFFAFFILLPFTLWLVDTYIFFRKLDVLIIVALFHTLFSICGALLFMPLIGQLERLIVKLIPENKNLSTRYLDGSLHEVPALAIAAAESVLRHYIADIYKLLIKCIRGEIILSMINTQEIDDIVNKVDSYLNEMPVPHSLKDQQRLMFLLRLGVYGRVLREDLNTVANIEALKKYELLEIIAKDFICVIEKNLPYLIADPSEKLPILLADELIEVSYKVKQQQAVIRQKIMEQSALLHKSAAHTLELLAAQRWFEHLVEHTARLVIVLRDENEVIDITG